MFMRNWTKILLEFCIPLSLSYLWMCLLLNPVRLHVKASFHVSEFPRSKQHFSFFSFPFPVLSCLFLSFHFFSLLFNEDLAWNFPCRSHCMWTERFSSFWLFQSTRIKGLCHHAQPKDIFLYDKLTAPQKCPTVLDFYA